MPHSVLRSAATIAVLAMHAASSSAGGTSALPALAASLDNLTVSGVSAGGYAAVQFQFAHATLVRGAGVIAAGPYYCAEGSTWHALTRCMSPSSWSPLPSPAHLRASAEVFAASGQNDPVDSLRDDRVWLLSGGRDAVVKTSVVEQLAALYGHWLPPAAIRLLRVPEAAHAMVSIADPQATACSSNEPPYINRCGDLDPAGEMFAHMLGPLQPPPAVLTGDLLAFDQRPFVAGKPIDASMAEEGYVYVPRACYHTPCRVHVAYHGCRQSAAQIGKRFVEGAGYNRWADNNRLIVLYPQLVPRYGPALGSWRWQNNPFACWDWWGYTGSAYATRDGSQVKAVRAMLERLATGKPQR